MRIEAITTELRVNKDDKRITKHGWGGKHIGYRVESLIHGAWQFYAYCSRKEIAKLKED